LKVKLLRQLHLSGLKEANGLATGRDRPSALPDELVVLSERQIEFMPRRSHGLSQLPNQLDVGYA
jgi:hypothetical protein